jgi:ABC-2 type transport system permease protein
MSATSPPAPAVAPPASVTGSGIWVAFLRSLRAEWTKLRSVRSTPWSFVTLVVASIGLTSLLTWLTVHSWSQTQAQNRARIVLDPVSFILGTGLSFGQLAICVLGVLVITSEYSSGSIRASVLAVPHRPIMLVSKGMVFAAASFVVGEVAAFGSFFLGAVLLHSKAHVAITDPGVARAVIGEGLYLMVLGLFAMAIGALVRHTAGAITGVIVFVLIIAPLAQLLPGSWGRHVHDYLPSVAGAMITQAHQQSDQVLSPWQGFAVFCAWTAVLLAAAIYFLQRRDA